jgi:WD40 repeat protein
VGREVRLAAADTGKEFARLRPRGRVYLTRFADDGKTVATVGSGELRLWEAATGREVTSHHFPGHAHGVSRLAFAPDGKAAASMSFPSDPACYWDAAGRLLHEFRPPDAGAIYAAGFSADGRPLAVGTEGGEYNLWDAATGKKLFRLAARGAREYVAAAFSPDGKRVAIQRVRAGERGAVLQVWDVATGREVWKAEDEKCPSFHAFEPRFHSFAFSGDGTVLAGTNMASPLVYRWDAATGKTLDPLPPHPEAKAYGEGLLGLAQSGDGRLTAAQRKRKPILTVGLPPQTGGGPAPDGTIRLWGTTDGREISEFAPGGEPTPAFALSPDGRVLAMTEGETIRLIELATGQERQRFTGHEHGIHALAFSPDGKALASGGGDTTVLLWDVSGQADAPAPADRDALWGELSEGAPRAYRAMRQLLALPAGDAVALLGKRLQALDGPSPARIERLLKDLDNDDFTVREKATAALAALGKAAEPQLREVMRGKPSAEVRRRVEELLGKLDGVKRSLPAAQDLAVIRAVEVLERVGTPEARAVLEKLSRGAAEDRRTLEAKAALRRLK